MDIEFNPTSLNILTDLPSATTIDKNVLDKISESIKIVEKSEIFWAEQLFSNPRKKINFEIYHIARLLKCSLLGFDAEVKGKRGTTDNPIVLESAEEFLKSTIEVWSDLATVTNKEISNEDYSVFKLNRGFEAFFSVGDSFIRNGRQLDIKNTPPSFIKGIKSSLDKTICEE